MSVRCLLGIFFVVEYPAGIHAKEFAFQPIEVGIFECGAIRHVKTIV